MMGTTFILEQDDARRSQATEFIQDAYFEHYGAVLNYFPEHLFARYDRSGHIACAAGLRTPGDGFFSELYLDRSIEQTIADLVGHDVDRSTVCEVTMLVSRSPQETNAFIDDIVALIAQLGFRWSFYTLTRRLALLLKHKGLSPIELAAADAARVPSPETWGRYYLTAPRVFAVSAEHLFSQLPFCGVELVHAVHH